MAECHPTLTRRFPTRLYRWLRDYFQEIERRELYIIAINHLIREMRENTYHFKGRGLGTGRITDACRVIECAEGTVMAITVSYGGIEFIHSHCRKAMIDRWGVYCADPFRRAGDAAITRHWAEPFRKGMFIFRPSRLVIVTEQPWMRQSA